MLLVPRITKIASSKTCASAQCCPKCSTTGDCQCRFRNYAHICEYAKSPVAASLRGPRAIAPGLSLAPEDASRAQLSLKSDRPQMPLTIELSYYAASLPVHHDLARCLVRFDPAKPPECRVTARRVSTINLRQKSHAQLNARFISRPLHLPGQAGLEESLIWPEGRRSLRARERLGSCCYYI